MFEDLTIMDYYYFSNRLWIDTNIIMILPFTIACIVRFFNQDIKKDLWTDYMPRFFLAFSWAFYIFDMSVKYPVDGADTVCEKAFFIHHLSSLVIFPPLFMNKHVPWWVCPIGFLHGLCIKYPQFQPLNYIYAFFLFVFQYGSYQEPYCNLKGYKISRYFMNFIWIFALLVLLGNCSNYLPTGPD